MGWEVADLESDELVVTSDMRSRKAEMDRRSDASWFSPVAWERWRSSSRSGSVVLSGMHRKPIVVLDPGRISCHCASWCRDSWPGFASPTVAAEVHWTADAATAFDLIEADWRAGEVGVSPPIPPQWSSRCGPRFGVGLIPLPAVRCAPRRRPTSGRPRTATRGSDVPASLPPCRGLAGLRHLVNAKGRAPSQR